MAKIKIKPGCEKIHIGCAVPQFNSKGERTGKQVINGKLSDLSSDELNKIAKYIPEVAERYFEGTGEEVAGAQKPEKPKSK